MSDCNSDLDTNDMHLCGPQTNNGIHRLRKNNITGNDSDSDYIYKYNIMTKEYKKKKAKSKCVCDLSKYIYGEKLLNNMNEDYTDVGYDYQDVLREIVLDELKQEKELQK
jgi:imidazole glycerol phosphate synthase subunit HisF